MSSTPLTREPGLNEKRCVIRHDLRFYNCLTTAGIYHLTGSNVIRPGASDAAVIKLFAGPLSVCIQDHPVLSVLIDGSDTNNPSYRYCRNLDLLKHVKVLEASQLTGQIDVSTAKPNSDSAEDNLIVQCLYYVLNDEFENVRVTPPWRVYVAPLSTSESLDTNTVPSQPQHQKILIAFAYSHSHGDGLSGLAFHHTFSNALRQVQPPPLQNTFVSGSSIPLQEAIDFPVKLPISWSYLLSALLNEFMPKELPSRLMGFLGLASASSTSHEPWVGRPCFFNDRFPQTAIQSLTIPSNVLAAVLAQGRKHGAKLTSILHQTIVNALCKELQNHGIHHTNSLITDTPLDLRKPHNTPATQMGVMASTHQLTISATPLPAPSSSNSHDQDQFWKSARTTTTALSKASGTLQDQPIGLLPYVSSLRKWHTDKLNKPRTSTYELSNIMTFDTNVSSNSNSNSQSLNGENNQRRVVVEKMFFAQGADVTGQVLSFNVVSVKGGDLVVIASWQVGALGLRNDHGDAGKKEASAADADERQVEMSERKFMAKVAGDIMQAFTTLASL